MFGLRYNIPTPSFNGATLIREWKVSSGILIGIFLSLQWGHSHSRVESQTAGRRSHRLFHASMRPLSFESGKPRKPGARAKDTARFNGATLIREWKVLHAAGKLQASLGFNGATLIREWKDRWSRRAWRAWSCFNGATLIREWKAESASCRVRRALRFNGATLIREWKGAQRRSGRTLHRRASMGPLSFESGKPSQETNCARYSCALQWGHSHSRVESDQFRAEAEHLQAASMGPLSFESGKRPSARALRRSRELQWGHSHSRVERLTAQERRKIYLLASMGPLSFESGKVAE